MNTAYEPKKYEAKILKQWADVKISEPETKEKLLIQDGKKLSDNAFCVPIPPPNVTGQLHLGHAMMLVIQDIMTRYHRMNGTSALWNPGTDHAAIATETVVLKNLGVASRENFTRGEFLEKCFDHTKKTHKTITNQVRQMGATCDFSRERFTMDLGMSNAVQKIFSDLYKQDLIVRGHRMVNWSTGAQSVLADDELEYEDQKDTFAYIKCGKFVMGTVRSETKCANSPLVLHPTEKYVKARFTKTALTQPFPEGEEQKNRIQDLVFSEVLFNDEERRNKIFNQLGEGTWEKISTHQGKEFEGEKFQAETYAGTREFFVLCDDEVIDINKGTGAMTISVCHSADDYLLAKKYPKQLKDYYFEKVGFDGKMTKLAGELAGVEVKIARKRAFKLMKAKGLIVGEELGYEHNVPLCYRTGCVVEPMISPQWFIDVNKEFDWQEGVGAVPCACPRKSGDHKGTPIQRKSLKQLTSEAINREDEPAGNFKKNSGDKIDLIPKRFNKIYDQWIDNLQDWCISRQIWWGHQIPIWYDENGKQHVAREQKLLFTRHGESENNVKKLIGGDSPLTDKGRSQATELGKKLISEGRNISKIIVSPFSRVTETGLLAKAELEKISGKNIPVETWDCLKEIDAGKYDNTPRSSNGESVLKKMLAENEGDSVETLIARAKHFWKKISALENDEEGEILIVSHDATLNFIFAVKDGATEENLLEHRSRWSMKNCEVKESLWMVPPKNAEKMRRDEDTLDTWFSSALWPFSTLGWPDKTPDFEKFFPTSVLETGHDILFFWVARMIMFSRFTTGKNPFSEVFLHGLVCDEHGKKMSKSKGNGIDPLEMIEKFGTDAVRMSLIVGTTPGNQVNLGEKKIEGFRNFANKLWNVSRYILSVENSPHPQPLSLGERGAAAFPPLPLGEGRGEGCSLPEQWILSKTQKLITEVSEGIEDHKYGEVGQKLYDFTWNDVADWAIESSKAVDPENSGTIGETLREVLSTLLKLLHPYIPFVTEQIWAEISVKTNCNSSLLALSDFPKVSEQLKNPEAEAKFAILQNVIGKIRSLRSASKVDPVKKITASLKGKNLEFLKNNSATIILMGRLENLAFVETSNEFSGEGVRDIVDGTEIFLPLSGMINPEEEAKRKEKELEDAQKMLKNLEGRIANKKYMDNAPEKLVQQTMAQYEEIKAKIRVLEG